MRAIRDGDGNTVTFIPVALEEGQESAVIPLEIEAEPGDKLRATSVPEAAVKGRLAPAAFTDLSITPITLPGGVSAVEIKIAAGAVAGLMRVALSLSLPSSSAAGWLA